MDAKSKMGDTLYVSSVFSTQENPSFLTDATGRAQQIQDQFHSYLVNQYPNADFEPYTECGHDPDFDKVVAYRKEVIKQVTDHFLGYTDLVVYTTWAPDK
jgi:predicted RecB family nuclease